MRVVSRAERLLRDAGRVKRVLSNTEGSCACAPTRGAGRPTSAASLSRHQKVPPTLRVAAFNHCAARRVVELRCPSGSLASRLGRNRLEVPTPPPAFRGRGSATTRRSAGAVVGLSRTASGLFGVRRSALLRFWTARLLPVRPFCCHQISIDLSHVIACGAG